MRRHFLEARVLAALTGAVLLAAASPVLAAPEEIQVYLDDTVEPGHFGLDVHQNYAISGLTQTDYAGQRPANHVYRLTPEFYYGLAPGLELGVYVLSTLDQDNRAAVDGAKMRLKYIAPHDEASGGFWGLNLEVGKSDRALEDHPWNYELKGIAGYRVGRYTLGANLNLDAALGAGAGPTTAELDTRFAMRIRGKTEAALELYDALGPVAHPGHLSAQSHTVYAVLDTDVGPMDLEVGLGRGLTSSADGWVVKVIAGFRF
jgi:hypothetical protein